jgi:SPX domain protein involved in polyphosphate accumulation
MTFKEELELNKTQEWEEKYINYYKLKKLIYEIKNQKIMEKKEKLKEEDYKIFFEVFHQELKRVNEFTLKEEEEFMNRHELLFQKNSFTEKERNDFVFTYKEHYTNLTILKNYLIINLTGILKKLFI